MQSSETVLNVIRERGRRGLPLERLYRQLFNRELFLVAYGRIYSNDGAMTPGVTGETVDGMSLAKIDTIIGALRSESYRWRPARRVYIEKKRTTRKRPLGMPTWSDKIVAEVVRLLLEAYYDVRFSDRSHGFRPGRGCHTALDEVAHTWTGTHWFVEGDISDCFGSLDHQVLVAILAEKIHDGRFLALIERMLKAGYLEDWRWNATLSGAPQGGIASPILSNIYLDRLDQFVEQQLIPEYTRGELRRRTPAYARLQYRIAVGKRLGDRETVSALRRQLRDLPSGDPHDPGYRRLKYVRYCDDFLLGFAGPKCEAEEIKARIQSFLREQLRLELSQPKTLITHATSQAAKFLGYEIKVQHADTKITSGKRSANGRVGLFVPGAVIRNRCASYMSKGKPTHRGLLMHDQDFTIVARYGAEYRGFIQYYLLAQNVHRLGRLRRVMEVSLLKTLAAKHKSSVNKMAHKYKATIETPDGPRTCYEAIVQRDNGRKPLIARFGGIPLKRKRTALIADIKPTMAVTKRNELIHRLLAGQCEMCEGLAGLQVHHVRKLADLNRPGRSERPVWVRIMAMRKRKTLVVCERCHQDIHAGRATVITRK
ncbi:reverse transcriptase domain-containing protein [Streptomyces sp. MMS24-I2-30]|uniref:reverse transcriptase/maturase family protein n=1 Tax=Streptomyces sp. MMS24-I2-30 TaxID=3351564 RepID=UPI003896BF53